MDRTTLDRDSVGTHTPDAVSRRFVRPSRRPTLPVVSLRTSDETYSTPENRGRATDREVGG